MPLVRIDLVQGKPADYRRAIGQAIYEAMRATINVPENDNFQIITEHPPENLVADPNYLGISRSADAVFIQITLNAGRTMEMKKALYKAVADGLYEKAGMRREDVIINLVEVPKENWSFGNGIAQYA
jgi:phenylpyruvate tautomerase PptA (4-oxalocrotonate tautomerase family)